ncbi:ATP synthase F0F1 subunit delta [Bifidobacterium sp. DSM 109958]|uniref:ATP synthase subunit delta n=1 Tax=Bifidobacterium moraviense TaxID=2675323 RepID=A0A7Y0F1K4_9BIFI|nr:F0F1 ATP synthase subunit delta [Bifidobacterium sp. DSM 109958]NMN00335.1 ATP synthase F0F1 subunit delta [Bifidobacterium sp. DSM 109958]
MQGEASLIADRESRDSFAPKLKAAGLENERIHEELFGFADMLDANKRVQRALSDPARPVEDKVRLVDALLSGQAHPLTVEILHDVVGRRWSRMSHLANAVEDFGVDSVMYLADARGVTLRVSIELAQLHSAILALPQVRSKLSDPYMATSDRVAFLKELLKGQQLDPITMTLAIHATSSLRNRRFLTIIQWLINKLSRHMGEMMVTVTTAVPLTKEQIKRLVATYGAKLNRPVHINSVVDPSVLGGMRVQYGSEVTDHTVVAQLQRLRRSVG